MDRDPVSPHPGSVKPVTASPQHHSTVILANSRASAVYSLPTDTRRDATQSDLLQIPSAEENGRGQTRPAALVKILRAEKHAVASTTSENERNDGMVQSLAAVSDEVLGPSPMWLRKTCADEC